MSKSLLRHKYIKLRKIKNQKDVKINLLKVFRLFKNFDYKKKIFGGYYPINYEMNILHILKELENQNVKISLPITMKNNDMDFYKWSSTDILILNKFGIPEPQKIEKVIPDILLIPLVSFDKNLFRIGYGGGFYDRYIEKVSKLKKTLNIGIAHSCQKVRKVPLNKYDKKLDIVITEKYILS